MTAQHSTRLDETMLDQIVRWGGGVKGTVQYSRGREKSSDRATSKVSPMYKGEEGRGGEKRVIEDRPPNDWTTTLHRSNRTVLHSMDSICYPVEQPSTVHSTALHSTAHWRIDEEDRSRRRGRGRTDGQTDRRADKTLHRDRQQ